MAKTDFRSVDEYIATHPEDVPADHHSSSASVCGLNVMTENSSR